MQLTIKVENLERVADVLKKLSGKEAKEAYAKALNDTGGKLQKAMRAELRTVFDQPTAYITKSPWVTRATADNLTAAVGPRNPPGRQGIDPQKILQAQEFGGRRADKRMEIAFRTLGLLPNGMQVALPASRYGGPYPGSDDGKGNFTGNFVRKVLAYFKTNLKDIEAMKKPARNRALKKYTFQTNLKTKREIKLMDGKEWFVSHGGPGRIAPGIWVRDGREMKCAVAFVSAASYSKPRLSMDAIAKAQDLQPYLDKRVRFRIREAAGI